jgi:hypothetical protein
MLVDVIRHQHAHVRAAVEALASLTESVAVRVRRAADEVRLAFHDGVPVWASPFVASIESVTDRAGDVEPAELAELTDAVVELYTLACREYWTA